MQSPAPTLAQKPWRQSGATTAGSLRPGILCRTCCRDPQLPAARTGVADSSCSAEASSAQIPSPFGPTCSAQCGELGLSFRYVGRCVQLYHDDAQSHRKCYPVKAYAEHFGLLPANRLFFAHVARDRDHGRLASFWRRGKRLSLLRPFLYHFTKNQRKEPLPVHVLLRSIATGSWTPRAAEKSGTRAQPEAEQGSGQR